MLNLTCPACAKQSVTFYADFACGLFTARCGHCGHVQEG
jgi:hypothetical protein